MKIATADFETDPFQHKSVPAPFCGGVYDGTTYLHWWGTDCVKRFLEWLETLNEPHTVYFHNGGKFDFFLRDESGYRIIDRIHSQLRLINGRIVYGKIGMHEVRDSYAILPFPLKDFSTHKEFDYSKMHRDNRDRNRFEILNYLKQDCVDLFTLCNEFIVEFGDKLTIGQTSIGILKKFHPFDVGKTDFDKRFRNYYFGGRCQCFANGLLQGPWEIVDVNSMYPAAMRNFRHPVSVQCEITKDITPRTNFALVIAKNYGALPIRNTKGSLDFTQEYGEFYATIHEINAGLATGTLEIKRVKHAVEFKHTTTFGEFVDFYMEARNKAKHEFAETGNQLAKARSLFYKTLLNSSYGKFAQNGSDYMDYQLRRDNVQFPETECEYQTLSGGKVFCGECEKTKICKKEWQIGQMAFDWILWQRPSLRPSYYNVAAAASITGAARALLIYGLKSAVEPIYCDTDSIICRQFNGDKDPYRLGAWKVEGNPDYVAIAGKKLYACFVGHPDNAASKCIKQASKGVTITPQEIVRLAVDPFARIDHANQAPKFRLDGKVQFVSRKVRKTAVFKGRQRLGRRLFP